MKRCFLLVCTALLAFGMIVSAVGCAQTKEATRLPQSVTDFMQSYDTVAQITYGQLEATAQIQKNSDALVITFLKPEALSGLTATLAAGKLQLQFGSLAVDLNELALGEDFVGSLMQEAINQAVEGQGITVELRKGQFAVQGKTEQGGYELLLDEKTGVLVSLDYPKQDLHIRFYEFRFGQGQNAA